MYITNSCIYIYIILKDTHIYLYSNLFSLSYLIMMLYLYHLYGYGPIPIDTICQGMNIHLPAILMFTRCQGFDPSPYIPRQNMSRRTWSSALYRTGAFPPPLCGALSTVLLRHARRSSMWPRHCDICIRMAGGTWLLEEKLGFVANKNMDLLEFNHKKRVFNGI